MPGIGAAAWSLNSWSRGGGGGSAGPNGAPSNLTLAVNGNNYVLNWDLSSTNENHNIVERSVNGSNFYELISLGNGIKAFTDENIDIGNYYNYRIVVEKNGHYSVYSNIVNNILGDTVTGRVALWQFEESSGATALDSASNNNGTIVGADRIISFYGKGLYFDGVVGNDAVIIGDNLDTTFSGNGAKFSIVTRYKPGTNNLNSGVILSKYFSGAGGQREFILSISGAKRVDTITLVGSSGTAAILCNGVNRTATFSSSLTQTAADFVTNFAAAYLATGVTVTANAGVLTFTAVSYGVDFTGDTTITNASGNLTGTVAHPTLPSTSKLRFTWYGALDGSSVYGMDATTTLINDSNHYYNIVVTYDQTLSLGSRTTMIVDGVNMSLTNWVSTGSPSSIQNGTGKLGIGGNIFSDNSSQGNLNGDLDFIAVHNKILTLNDALAYMYFGMAVPNSGAVLHNYTAGVFDDMLVDAYHLSDLQGVKFIINKPAKYAGNPIFGSDADTWDRDKGYYQIQKIADVFYGWYSALPVSTPTEYWSAYAESIDGKEWVKPNLGLVSYGGNTNNNLIIGKGAFGINVIYQPNASADMRWLATLANNSSAADGYGWEGIRRLRIYKSADRKTWTFIKEVYSYATQTQEDPNYFETSSIIRRDDGRYVAYVIKYGLLDLRAIGAWLSDTDDPTGSWTDMGVIVPTTLHTSQKYGNYCVNKVGEIFFCMMNNYNSTTGKMFTDLYLSRDALNFVKRFDRWITLGASGEWDDEMILGTSQLIQVGNEWYSYYTGSAEGHAHAVPRESKLGLSTIGYKRIGGIMGVGNFVTSAFTPTQPLIINADLTNGTLKVELLLAADNSVIAGYSKDDCNALTGDTYSTEVKWGANSILTDRSLKIKFYLT